MTSIECAPGRPVSGRTWKEPAQKASQRATMKTLHVGYHKRMDETRRIRQMKSIEKELKDEKEAARKKFIEIRKAKLERKIENEKKSEVFQLITNAQKLKRLKKSQIRNVVERSL